MSPDPAKRPLVARITPVKALGLGFYMDKELTEESIFGRLGIGADGPTWAACEIGPPWTKGGFFSGTSRVSAFCGNWLHVIQEKSDETDWEVLNVIKSVAGSTFEKDELSFSPFPSFCLCLILPPPFRAPPYFLFLK